MDPRSHVGGTVRDRLDTVLLLPLAASGQDTTKPGGMYACGEHMPPTLML